MANIQLIGGEKGGVGKSVVARVLAQAPAGKNGERSVRARIASLMKTLWPHEPARSRAEFAKLLKQARELSRSTTGDETPPGPVWVALWTEDDKTVVPPTSGELEGALDYAVQTVCPDLTVGHPDVPRTPAIIAMVESALGPAAPARPGPEVCTA